MPTKNPKPVLEIPPDVKKALAKSKAAKAKFEKMPPSHQREYLGYVLEAKKAETRARRIEKMIVMLEKK
jgi:uncharacterized protein YdeI (YjbR/CyaY-like superfamily)